MRHSALFALVTVIAALAGAQSAYSDRGHGHGHGHGHRNAHGRGGAVVWVQTNEVSGNRILVYDRASDGTLSEAGTYATKMSGSHVDVFHLRRDGTLSATPVVNNSATPVPFAFTFTPQGRLADGEAGTSSLTTYQLNGDGTLADPGSATHGQTALCWIVRARGFYYVSEHRIPHQRRRFAELDRQRHRPAGRP